MIDVIDGYCIVKSQSNSSKVYEVYLCDGSYCNCQDQSSLLCKHIRAAARCLGGLEIWKLSLDSERVAFYQNNNIIQNQFTLNSIATNQFLCEETLDQNQDSLNSNANPNQPLCKELEDLKIIIQRIQNLSNTANGIEIKKQAEFQMKEVRKFYFIFIFCNYLI